jgi:glycerol-3-phosphate cytidylyltransferase
MKIGFTCGSFDLCHAGHILAFKEAKSQCDYLLVGLQTDPHIDRPTKNKPIQTLEERKIQLEAVKYIDEVIVYETEADLYSFLKNNLTNISVRFLGEDWKGKHFTGDDLPLEVIFTPRTHNYSTTELRERIKKAN